MDSTSSPARVTLGIFSVLTISTVIQGMKSMLPQVNYLTALDLYLWTCFFFVCVTLVQFIYLNYITIVRPRYQGIELNSFGPRENYRDNHLLVQNSKENTDSDDSANNSTESSMEISTVKSSDTFIAPRDTILVKAMKTWRASRDKKRLTKSIDGRFRIVYFSSFVVFNIWYWIYYFFRASHNIH